MHEYATAGEAQLERNAHRMRDDLDPGSYGAMLSAHWASEAPEKYKIDYDRFVVQHATRQQAAPYPNYSIGTRGMPFYDQKTTDGRYRGRGLY
jgi:hypothetical protein